MEVWSLLFNVTVIIISIIKGIGRTEDKFDSKACHAFVSRGHACIINMLAPRRATRAHLPITGTTKPSSTQERYLFGSGRKILEHIAAASSLITLSVYLQNKTVGLSMVQNLSGITCVSSVPIH